MRLVHYSPTPIDTVLAVEPRWDRLKPSGLWVSDDDCEDNWRAWCEAERFRLDSLACPHDVELAVAANVLILRTAFEIDAFTREWAVSDGTELSGRLHLWMAWDRLSERYQGLIITPYIWERRLSMGDGTDSMWYYAWDCASGCIWDPAAIASITSRANA